MLWASTGTKNKAYSDVLYVEELIGRDTVNTMPVATLDAFRDHGKLRDSLEEDAAGAQRMLDDLGRAGISLDSVTDKLVDDGVQLFADAADKLLAAVAKKRSEILDQRIDAQNLALDNQLEKNVGEIAEDWRARGNIRKLWQRDKSLWTNADEDRWLGWLDSVDDEAIAGYAAFAEDIKRDGFKDAVLLGMGGSSLGPEVLATTFGQKDGWPRVRILDSTVPAQIEATEAALDLAKTLFIVSSKSGSTTEPNILRDYFFKRVADKVGADKGRPAIYRHHRSRIGAGEKVERARLPPHLLRRSQHRRALFGAVAVRTRAGGHRRHRCRAAGAINARDDAFVRARRAAVGKSRHRTRHCARRRGFARPRQGHDPGLAGACQFRRLGRATVRGIDRKERQGSHPDRRRTARAAGGLRRRPLVYRP